MNQKGTITAAAVVIASLVSVGMAQPAFAAAGPKCHPWCSPRPDRDHLGGRDQYHLWQSSLMVLT